MSSSTGPSSSRYALTYKPIPPYSLYGLAFESLPPEMRSFLLNAGLYSPCREDVARIIALRQDAERDLMGQLFDQLYGWLPILKPVILQAIPQQPNGRRPLPLPVVPLFHYPNNFRGVYMPHIDPGAAFDEGWRKDLYGSVLDTFTSLLEEFQVKIDALVWYEVQVHFAVNGVQPPKDKQLRRRNQLSSGPVGKANNRFFRLICAVVKANNENASTRRWVEEITNNSYKAMQAFFN